ncbi:MAG: hypothetical protein WBC91_09845 [Phototrophicaceae bacterium]
MTRQNRIQHYTHQIERLSQRIKQIEAQGDHISNLRLLLAVAGGIPLAILVFTSYSILFWGLLAFVIGGFALLINRHRRIQQSLKKHHAWRAIKQENRARILLDWKRIPELDMDVDEDALEVDFDLRELHRLLNTASSQTGTLRLRNWLLNTEPHLPTITQRQKLVQEIKERPTFRDKLTLYARLSSAQVKKQMNTQWLRHWLQSEVNLPKVDLWLTILSVLAIANVIAVVLSQMGVVSSTISGVMWGIYALVYVSRTGLISELNNDSQAIYDVFQRLESVMAHLERYPYTNMPTLRKLCAPLLEAKPSEHIKRLMGTIAASSLRGNPLIWLLLNAIMPWDMFFLRRLHQQKQQLATYMPQWLDIWYEVEALNSLATYAHLNPEGIMPTLNQDIVFKTSNMGHPLLSPDSRIVNSFEMQSVGNLAILTGSNMSGKSSFLRTLGVNLTMAYAGGVVIADDFQAGLFRLFSCIRVTDSLDDGISYFYAEVKRLHALLEALEADHDLPLFFVIDEIFRGTNNRERLIGSRSYINALAGANGIGLIATHDLELTQLADGNSNIRNLHFREHVADGRMVFDYILRDGASPTTNALQIMAMEGLPVDDADFKQQLKR